MATKKNLKTYAKKLEKKVTAAKSKGAKAKAAARKKRSCK